MLLKVCIQRADIVAGEREARPAVTLGTCCVAMERSKFPATSASVRTMDDMDENDGALASAARSSVRSFDIL